RDQVLNLHRIEGSLLSRHSSLPNAYVYTPIVEFSVDDVWQYLLQVPSPWSNNNRDLLALYRSANAGECPLVVDNNTGSCGNSRFGCWVCTVVQKDKSMEALVDSGEQWLIPLLEFREFLAETQDPEKKHLYRDYRRRDGKVWFTKDGSIVRGPYTFKWRKEFLKRLLIIQENILKEMPGKETSIIAQEELYEIRNVWRTEDGDWEDSVPAIYREVTGKELECVREDAAVFTGDDYTLLNEVCSETNVSTELIAQLIDMERQLHGMARRSSVFTTMDNLFHCEWRSEDEMKAISEQHKTRLQQEPS
ncbi:MAG TPA: DNA phosphorothioation system sulfurtransferase DndC, partial [Synergistaceae bacterium]|nr:DNA phosphorothioation system sulfurtransferase DndC [Synergistaceae bacterium]